ncbi:TcmI family type II polyketide cyclase [Paractinoplanes toevensis]|uniref:Uncharacterized protein n=1 Tax=Paractinoplanes toevensis TaxID=571911 RepID=A0A919W889_9ACTN|nr:TcmI family type II polyketide cyclase [Actinoplanes toevensis]GIM92601.1 hypothetical protein Ato02nite_043940 [Actinoplanes toevensis]
MQRVIFIDRMPTDNAAAVADAWSEHDRTDLPRLIGVRRRSLYAFHGLYVHVVDGAEGLEQDLTERILSSRADPSFVRIRDRLGRLLTPYRSDTRSLADTRAEEFYRWEAPEEF